RLKQGHWRVLASTSDQLAQRRTSLAQRAFKNYTLAQRANRRSATYTRNQTQARNLPSPRPNPHNTINTP
ncbi:hypothetical protein A2U01_0101909, partial [Trifolium medium]|nr:hypothetical protein [Trifolium medium]